MVTDGGGVAGCAGGIVTSGGAAGGDAARATCGVAVEPPTLF